MDQSRQLRDVERLIKGATQLYDDQEVQVAIDRLAVQISGDYEQNFPILLCVMNGGIVFTGHLMTRLSISCELDYIHATRYQGALTGERVRWLVQPQLSLRGRDVLILDDIHDVGLTLDEIVAYCEERGASSVKTAVLVNKEHSRKQGRPADYSALNCPDQFLFGYGMDYRGYLRNAAGIYALSSD